MKPFFLPANEVEARIAGGCFDEKLLRFYGVSGSEAEPYRRRLIRAVKQYTALYGERDIRIFSVSGRTELGGNHTDHQGGCVLAGGISLDMIAVAAPDSEPTIRIYSEGYGEECIAVDETAVNPCEYGTSAALIRGIVSRFGELGKPVGGLSAYITSDVPQGSGLSSSAAYEVLLALICNDFYADSAFPPAELAKIAQYAENAYFGKPCGLMDQMACALGGIVMIDFADAAAPVWKRIPAAPAQAGYVLCIIDSGADHAGMTAEYASIPAEMHAVANLLGKDRLRDTDEALFWEQYEQLRNACGDRAVLRAVHFYGDNARVSKQAEALEQGDFEAFLALVRESGNSSAMYLQNIYPAGASEKQGIAAALALCSHLLNGRGAWRVHGGGFAGTVQAYVPASQAEAFRNAVDRVRGTGACRMLQIRECGAAALWDNEEETNSCC